MPKTLDEIQKRMAQIATEVDHEDADLDKLDEELTELRSKQTVILDKAEKRKKMLEDIANDPNATVLESQKKEERGGMTDKLGIDSVEYRNAYLKTLLGEELTDIEQRAYTHTTANSGAVVPTKLVDKIYSNMEEAHPLLKDVQVLRTGAVLTIAKHVSIDAGDAKEVAEGVANDDEKNTFVDVTLAGKDFSKHVDFSYRLGKMSIPAFEQYLVNEIGERIGSAMTRDIVAQIYKDVNAANKTDSVDADAFKITDVSKTLAKLKGAGKVYAYMNSTTFYGDVTTMDNADNRLSFVPNYEQGISGQLIGKGIKQEDALADGVILFLAPDKFIYNVVQDVLIERDKDIKKHVHTIAGFAIAEGTLTHDKAAAILSILPPKP